ncbi:sensor domain-containing protein [Cognatilysobacter segetis]|uniref:sensor domain-containing protein n=1 Tax=Cognatilysobacter segetis TaxID=2492394 RepID=UPI00105F57DA|nr:PAS domain S-box protein [Lysobacter segetis]
MNAVLPALDPDLLGTLRRTFADAPFGLGCVDASGRWLHANAALRRLLGDELPALGTLAAPAHVAALADLLDGRRARLRLEPSVANGRPVLDLLRLRDARGGVPAFVVHGEDAGARAHAVAERDAFFALTPDLLAFLDARDRLVEANPAWETTLGFAPRDLVGRRLAEFVHDDDRDRALAVLAEVRDGLADASFRCRLRSRYGGWRWIEWQVREFDVARLYCTARDVTAQVRARDAQLRHHDELERRIAQRTHELDRALARLQLHADNSPLATIEWDRDLRVSHWSHRAREMFGWREDEVLGRGPGAWPFVQPGDAAAVDAAMGRLRAREASRHVHRVHMRARDGRVRTCEWFDSALFDGSGQVSSILSLVQDVTDREVAVRALADSEERFRLAFDQTAVGMAHVDLEGRWLRANRRLPALLGRDLDALAGTAVRDLVHPSDRARTNDVARLLDGGVDTLDIEVRLLRADGAPRWTRQTVSLRRDADGRPVHFILVVEDIEARKAAEAALQRAHEELEAKVAERTRELERLMAVLEDQARQDPLTGLPNRRGLMERLPRSLDRSARHDGATVVMFVDLDRFKQVNDTRGHEAGDTLLRACAQRLLAAVRRTDIVARLGGDEFVIVLENVRDPARHARRVAEKVREALALPVDIDGRPVAISASIGVVLHPHGTVDAEELIARADRRMYAAKHAGGNAVRSDEG